MHGKAIALAQVGATTVVYMAAFQLNAWLFNFLNWSAAIAWIFLPAGIRLLGVLLFGGRGALGLWLGAIITNAVVFGDDHPLQMLIGATLSAVNPLVAAYITMRWLKIPLNLHGLTASRLVIFALVGALCNAVLSNLYFWLAGLNPNLFVGIPPMFIGDLTGTVIVLYTLRAALVMAERFVRFAFEPK
jgi:hypothetical protein